MFFDDDFEEEVDSFANTFTTEPVFNCPQCNTELHTDWVDNGFGPYSVQASPYGCECGWHETGCAECIKEKCFSWAKCQGRALVNPASKEGVNIDMNILDPNTPQAAENQEAAIQPAEAQEQNQEATQENAEEGGVEG